MYLVSLTPSTISFRYVFRRNMMDWIGSRTGVCSGVCLHGPSQTLSAFQSLAMQRVASTSVRLGRASTSLRASRRLATAAGTKAFADKLASGPSLDDFIAGDVDPSETVVLGNTSQYA